MTDVTCQEQGQASDVDFVALRSGQIVGRSCDISLTRAP